MMGFDCKHTPALALALALCSFSSRAYCGWLAATCWPFAGFWATSEDVMVCFAEKVDLNQGRWYLISEEREKTSHR